MVVELKRRRFTVDEYDQMVRAGILTEDDRVELIEGEIVEMAPIGARHAQCANRITSLLVRRFDEVAIVAAGNPVRLEPYSEPEPDFTLIRRRAYGAVHPGPEDIFLAIEVSDTTIEADRRVKAPLYARHRIPELWIVDLGQGIVSVYRDPAADGYRTVRVARPGEQLAIAAFPDRPLSVSDMLPE